MFALFFGNIAHATSYSHEPTVEEVLAASSVVVHGIVTQTQSCVGSRAFTFVTLDVAEVIRGTLESDDFALFASFPSGESLLVSPVPEIDPTCDPGPVEWVWDDPFATAAADDGAPPPGPVLVAGGCSIDEDWDAAVATEMATATGAFTFRLPYGEYPDGTVGTIVDTLASRSETRSSCS